MNPEPTPLNKFEVVTRRIEAKLSQANLSKTILKKLESSGTARD